MAIKASIGACLRTWCPPVVIHTRSGCIVGETVVVVINFSASVLKHRDDVIKRAEAIRIIGAAWIVANGDDSIVAVVEYQICLLG
jgi:hypothetical protein